MGRENGKEESRVRHLKGRARVNLVLSGHPYCTVLASVPSSLEALPRRPIPARLFRHLPLTVQNANDPTIQASQTNQAKEASRL